MKHNDAKQYRKRPVDSTHRRLHSTDDHINNGNAFVSPCISLNEENTNDKKCVVLDDCYLARHHVLYDGNTDDMARRPNTHRFVPGPSGDRVSKNHPLGWDDILRVCKSMPYEAALFEASRAIRAS